MLTLNSMLTAQRQAESYGQGGRHYFDGRHEGRVRRKPSTDPIPGTELNEERVRSVDTTSET